MAQQSHPMGDRHVTAVRALVQASQHHEDGPGLVDAIGIHTAFLDRDELLGVIGLLLGILSTVDLLAVASAIEPNE